MKLMNKTLTKFAKTLEVGKVCNVRSSPDSEPLMRAVTAFGPEKRNGESWFYWYWKKGGHVDGQPDCGYSGVKL